MTITLNGKYYSNDGNSTVWREEENGFSGPVTLEPSRERIAEMCALHKAALQEDLAAIEPVSDSDPASGAFGMLAPLLDTPTSKADVVAASFGDEWVAYKMYESARLAIYETSVDSAIG